MVICWNNDAVALMFCVPWFEILRFTNSLGPSRFVPITVGNSARGGFFFVLAIP